MMDKVLKTKWQHDQHLIQLTNFFFFLASERTIGQPGIAIDPVFI